MVRAVVFLVLAGLLVLGAVEFGPAAMERLGMASPAADGGAADEAFAKLEASLAKQGVNASDLSNAPPAADEAAPEPRQTYRYFDGSGTMHFVDALEKVPEPFRASAKPMGGSELPQLTRAAKTKVHRPAGYGTSIRKIKRDPTSPAQEPAARRGDLDSEGPGTDGGSAPEPR
jgi:hypothetical protein